MKLYNQSSFLSMFLYVCIMLAGVPASAQDQIPKRSGPINLDEALKEPVPTDRAASYYYFALAKLNAGEHNLEEALSQMKKALDYNRESSAIHLEMARLLNSMGRSQEALSYAEKAAELDPKDPDPHRVMFSIYYNTQPSLNAEFKKAVQELETIRELDPQDGSVYYYLGKAYFELNEPEKAIQAYEKFQNLVKDTNIGYREIAKYYYTNKNAEKAIEYLEKALALQPESIEGLNDLGRIYSDLGRIQDAIAVYQKLLQVTGDNPPLQHYLASLLYEDGDYDKAAPLLEDVLKADPKNDEARILLGRIQIEQNKYDTAIETLKSIESTDPDIRKKALFQEGLAYKNSDQLSKAIEIFRDLLKNTPNTNGDDLNNRLLFQYHLVSMYLKLGENEEAIAIAKQGYEKNPENLRIGIFYAQTLADAGKFDRSVQILNELLESNPSEIDLYIHMSQIFLQEERFPEAENILEQAEKIDPGDETTEERLKIQRVSVYERQKDYDRAESLLNEILNRNPDHAGALNYLGYMLADRGIRLPEALDYVKKALLIDPDNGAYLDSLGWAYFKLNDLDNAEIYLLRAGKLEKDDPVINDHLGDLYFKTGDFEKARNFWMQSIRVSTEEKEIQKVRSKLNKLPGKPENNSQ